MSQMQKTTCDSIYMKNPKACLWSQRVDWSLRGLVGGVGYCTLVTWSRRIVLE